MTKTRHLLAELYNKLWTAFGPQGWWPGESPFEIALGAILTQNTNWQNVARVIAALKRDDLLTPQALAALPTADLAQRLRPVGYYNIKARRLQNFLAFLDQHFENSMDLMAKETLAQLRPLLLAVPGIGPETADSILLYALHKPTFIVDAYTFRILGRHALVAETCTYDELRQFFMDHLPADTALYQEFHALLVHLGKTFCRPKPRCEACPLNNWPQPDA